MRETRSRSHATALMIMLMHMSKFRIDDSDAPVTHDGWAPISNTKVDPSVAATDVKKQAIDAWKLAERKLTELLQCDQLMCLTGLGTSLCVKKTDGKMIFPTMGGLWALVKAAVGAATFEKVCEHVNHGTGGNIEDLLSRCFMAVELAPKSPASGSASPDIATFIKTAEATIVGACRQELKLEETATHEEFLRRLTRRAPRSPRACLFTTNYDLCFEVAAARIGLTVIDGFSFSTPPRFQSEMFDYDVVTGSSYSKEPDFIPRLLRLFKLHGSVDWHTGVDSIEKKADTNRPVLIYPQYGKYAASYSPPFLEVMSRFQGMLRHRNVGLLITGCGLNDLHLAEPILAAIKSNTSLRVAVCSPDLCDLDAKNLYGKTEVKDAAPTNKVLGQLHQLLQNGDSRLTLVNGFFPDLVKLMPMLSGQTDADQHESRIKALETWVAKQRLDKGVGA